MQPAHHPSASTPPLRLATYQTRLTAKTATRLATPPPCHHPVTQHGSLASITTSAILWQEKRQERQEPAMTFPAHQTRSPQAAPGLRHQPPTAQIKIAAKTAMPIGHTHHRQLHPHHPGNNSGNVPAISPAKTAQSQHASERANHHHKPGKFAPQTNQPHLQPGTTDNTGNNPATIPATIPADSNIALRLLPLRHVATDVRYTARLARVRNEKSRKYDSTHLTRHTCPKSPPCDTICKVAQPITPFDEQMGNQPIQARQAPRSRKEHPQCAVHC